MITREREQRDSHQSSSNANIGKGKNHAERSEMGKGTARKHADRESSEARTPYKSTTNTKRIKQGTGIRGKQEGIGTRASCEGLTVQNIICASEAGATQAGTSVGCRMGHTSGVRIAREK